MKRQTFWIEVTRRQFLALPMNIRRKELRGHADKFVTLEVVAAKLDASEKRNEQWQKKWELSCETLGNSIDREKALVSALKGILAITDRKHVAWDAAHAALKKAGVE